MAGFFDLSREIVKLQDTVYPISNEIQITILAATEIERLLDRKFKISSFQILTRPL